MPIARCICGGSILQALLPAALMLWFGLPSNAAPNLPDPCKLITKAEAETILGEPVREPEPGGLGGTKYCDYKTVKVYGGITPYWIHIAVAPESPDVWSAGKKLHAKETRPASGIGDDAYFLLEDLEIYKKQIFVTINVVKNIDKPDHAKAVEAAEKSVAEKAIPRI